MQVYLNYDFMEQVFLVRVFRVKDNTVAYKYKAELLDTFTKEKRHEIDMQFVGEIDLSSDYGKETIMDVIKAKMAAHNYLLKQKSKNESYK